MILETALAHGNSAIMSTIENILFKKSIFEILKYGTYLPAARAWLPWFGKFYFPTYNPCGIQPLSSVKKISTKIPIIIMHHINDPQLSINNARKLYCALRQAGNNNAYLFECTSNHCEIQKTHFNILNTDEPHEKNRKICAIQAIYKKHGLPFNAELLPSSLAVDLTPFQPNIEQVKEKINLSTKKGRYIRNTIDTVFCTYLVIHIMIRLHLLMLTKTYLK